jgi:saccharopine dehydrogenase-like NADP-dependent oxidoreductase
VFFGTDEIEVGGVKVRPLDVTSRILFPKWKLREGEVDLTVMKIVVEGMRGGLAVRYTYDLLDRLDPATGIHSMARTTGYTAACALRMLVDGLFADKGIIAPEFIAATGMRQIHALGFASAASSITRRSRRRTSDNLNHVCD